MLKSERSKMTRRQPGQVVLIELGQGNCSYARVLNDPLVAFYDLLCRTTGEISVDEVISSPVAFTLMVMNHAITRGRWPVVGRVDISPEFQVPPPFCKQDAVTGKLSIYQEVPELAPNYERPARVGECLGLETAAIWEPEHVEDRLRDHFAGEPNKWVEQLKVIESAR
jgi:hypothetical protein